MYNFENIKPTTKEELFKLVSTYDIFRHYYGEFEEDRKYKSPFRHEQDPSFVISQHNGHWVYRDFGESPAPDNAVQFVMRITGMTYREAIIDIFNNLNGKSSPDVITETQKKIRPASVLFSKTLLQAELDYFAQGKITKETLEHFKVRSCRELWYDGKILSKSTKSKPLVVYMFGDEVWKAYGPLHHKQRRFFSYNIGGHIQGMDMLPDTGEFLFITKSYKDVMVFYELGYPAIAPHSENGIIDPWDITDLKNRFKYIYVNYDNDKTGINHSKEVSDLYGLYYWNVPHELNTMLKPTKDPFDLVKNYSQEKMKSLLYKRFTKDGLEP